MGGTHLLWSNFNSLGQPREAKITAAAGVAVTVVLMIFAFTDSSKANLGLAIGLILAFSGRFIAELYQLKKEAIANSTEYTFRSNWKVFGISLAWLAVTLATVVLISFVLNLAGMNTTD